MTGAEYLVDHLIKLGVTDVFGIPGGVVLDFLYELDRHKSDITVHLSFHEQCSGFAASGYAQLGRKLGVAYATKGPGITNLLTPVADAYSDGNPVLIITAHSEEILDKKVRFTGEQELDTVEIFKSVTKYAVRIDSAAVFPGEVQKACDIALEERKGPVLIDVLTGIFSRDVSVASRADMAWHGDKDAEPGLMRRKERRTGSSSAAIYIRERLWKSRRPVLLAGDGIHQCGLEKPFCELAEKAGIPVLSSRCSGDIMPGSDLYFGYIGSHGIRYANFVLSKADLIIALGNRLAFPVSSASFRRICENAEIIWVESDRQEAGREIPNCTRFCEDARNVLSELERLAIGYLAPYVWLEVCKRLKKELFESDVGLPVRLIAEAMKNAGGETVIVNDVGNNEFWASRAYLYSGAANRMLYSKCFGALGCALGKSIGVHYACSKPVLCITGDQGLQLNSQELQFIGMHRLPVAVLLLNNHSSGMIRSREEKQYGRFVHTTVESGYGTPDFEKLAGAYGMEYYRYDPGVFQKIDKPILIEAQLDEEIDLEPNLPKGNPCQRLVPEIGKELFEELDAL